MKNQNTIFYIIGTVILVALIINSQVPKETGMIGLIPRYYKDGVEVFPTKGFLGFSMVTPPGGSFDQIGFDISGSNTGDLDIINMQIVDASPQVFKDAIMPLAHQTLNLGQTKKLWAQEDYGLMDIVQFESMIQPVDFWVQISGEDEYGNIEYVEDSVPLTIEAEFSCPVGIDNLDGTCTFILQEADTENLADVTLTNTNEQIDGIIIKFNISTIPAGQQITNAILYLFMSHPFSESDALNIYRIPDQSWSESSSMFALATVWSEKIDLDNTQETGVLNTFNNFDVTAKVETEYNDGKNSISMGMDDIGSPLVSPDSSNTDAMYILFDWYSAPVYYGDTRGFYSKEYLEDISLRPKLEITYTPLSHVKFRTSDLSYGSASTIAFNTACDGSDLDQYDWEGSNAFPLFNCEQQYGTPIITNLPGLIHSNCQSNPINLYYFNNKYRIACNNYGAPACYYSYYSDTISGTEPATSIDPLKEVSC